MHEEHFKIFLIFCNFPFHNCICSKHISSEINAPVNGFCLMNYYHFFYCRKHSLEKNCCWWHLIRNFAYWLTSIKYSLVSERWSQCAALYDRPVNYFNQISLKKNTPTVSMQLLCTADAIHCIILLQFQSAIKLDNNLITVWS